MLASLTDGLFSSLSPSSAPAHPAFSRHIQPNNSALNLQSPSYRKQVTSLLASPQLLPNHPLLHSGVLPNGLSYIILPNQTPASRFECHLQVFSGSSNELHHQQGLAHLTEHVAYMGSKARERLFGTGSSTNAYTDFQHTVFYACCPNYSEGGGGGGPASASAPASPPPSSGDGGGSSNAAPMLPLAFDALREVLCALPTAARLQSEIAAVLSELTMVNTMDYRVECSILATLHRENRLAKRFPIGKESLIPKWTVDDVKTFHRTHYRPDNALLYVVGDVDVAEVEARIKASFGDIDANAIGMDIPKAEAALAHEMAEAVKDTVKSQESWHFPPVVHHWTEKKKKVAPPDPITDAVDATSPSSLKSSSSSQQQSSSPSHQSSPPASPASSSPSQLPSNYDLQLQLPYPLDDTSLNTTPTIVTPKGSQIRSHIFTHELLQTFSLHVFAKRRIVPVSTTSEFRRSLARRIALAAIQIRLNVIRRGADPPATSVSFNQLDSPREGCAVCSLDLTADPSRWKEAVSTTIKEIVRLGKYGVSQGEVERYARALLTDACQVAAQGDRISHTDQLAYLMESGGCGHAFLHPEQSLALTQRALKDMTAEEVSVEARALCEHFLSLRDEEEPIDGPIIAVACNPNNPNSSCTPEALVQELLSASNAEVEPLLDVVVPPSLVDPQVLDDAMEAKNPQTGNIGPQWEDGVFTDGSPNAPRDAFNTSPPMTLRRLDNGIKVNVASIDAESQRGHLRLVATGGRVAEKMCNFKTGSMAVGARTMQEGGAFGPWSREQVELFCVDHLIMVEINCNEEFMTFDFVFPTTNIGGNSKNSHTHSLKGTEAVLQIVREIINGFKWEEDAFARSKLSFHVSHDGLSKNLEATCTEQILSEMTGSDRAYLSVNNEEIEAITLEDAKLAVMSQLIPEELEVSMTGDFDETATLELIKRYLGTIPKATNRDYSSKALQSCGMVKPASTPVSVPALEPIGKHLEIELQDRDPRAVAYVSGSAPNRWGFFEDGTTVASRIALLDAQEARSAAAVGDAEAEADERRRRHPLFANCALSLIAEIVNRRLFSTVREKKQLTYDANFHFTGFERIKGGYFLCTVTASKEKAAQAMEACKETLEDLLGSQPITSDNLESAKRVVLTRHDGDLRTNRYWAELMSGMQLPSIPMKGPLSVMDYDDVCNSITVRDAQLVYESLRFERGKFFTAIGRTTENKAETTTVDTHSVKPLSGGRGGPLMW